MLKKLFALPTDSIIHEASDGDGAKEFLRARTLGDQWSVSEYRARLADCLTHQSEIDAACWFADTMGISREGLFGESTESILQACLLTRIARRAKGGLPGSGGLLSAQELKDFLKAFRRAKKKSPLKKDLLDDVPDAHREVILRQLKKMAARDLPRIIDMKVAFNDLLRE